MSQTMNVLDNREKVMTGTWVQIPDENTYGKQGEDEELGVT